MQLIDTFKPSSILVEDGPMQVIKDAEHICEKTGLLNPTTYDLTHEIYGDIFKQFITRYIEGNTDVYDVEEGENIVSKRFDDDVLEPFDMGSYSRYHLKKLLKTNSVTDDTKLVFSDLTAEGRHSSDILQTYCTIMTLSFSLSPHIW